MAGDGGLNALSLLPENVLPPIGSRKCASQKIFACPVPHFSSFFVFSSFFGITLGSGWIFRTKCDFLQVLDLLIFRQK
jgi:hypothetical protein